MNHAFVRSICSLLVACLACLPFQAQAGMIIGTGHSVAAATQADAANAARAGLIGKLQEYGLASEQARQRVAALTDAEVLALADRVGDAPAGALSGAGIGAILVILFLIWRFTLSDQAKAEQGKK
jgi:3-oxoacyl-ACP reductase-like protein